MAKQLDAFPPAQRGDSKYPWSEWGNGKVWELVRGTEQEVEAGKADFDTPVGSMRQTVAKAARRMGTKAQTRGYKRDGVETLVIQFKAETPKRVRGKSGA